LINTKSSKFGVLLKGLLNGYPEVHIGYTDLFNKGKSSFYGSFGFILIISLFFLGSNKSFTAYFYGTEALIGSTMTSKSSSESSVK